MADKAPAKKKANTIKLNNQQMIALGLVLVGVILIGIAILTF